MASTTSRGNYYKRKSKECVTCGVSFVPSRPEYPNCSKKCGGIYKNTSVKVNCGTCGQEINRKLSHYKKHKSHYCSRSCADKGHSKFMIETMGKIPKGNKNYISGRRYEYKVVNYLKSVGYIAQRSPGSRGVFDVWGFVVTPDAINLRFIQVKAYKNINTDKALSKKDKSIMIDRISNNNFTWAEKIKGVPKWSKTTTFELWVFNKKGKCNKFKLDFTDEVKFIPFEEN